MAPSQSSAASSTSYTDSLCSSGALERAGRSPAFFWLRQCGHVASFQEGGLILVPIDPRNPCKNADRCHSMYKRTDCEPYETINVRPASAGAECLPTCEDLKQKTLAAP